MTKNLFLYHILPGVLFAGLILLFSSSMAVSRTRPIIHSVEPSRVSPGDLMILKGEHFGSERGKSKVFLNKIPLTASFIESWEDQSINVRVPPINSSGLISIQTSGGESQGALFILSERVPDLAAAAFLPGKPFLSGVSDFSFFPGELVVLKGDKLGARKGNSRILVSLNSEEQSAGILDIPDEEYYFSVPDSMIYTWQDNSVSFFLPPESRSGSVYIHSSQGYSNPLSIEVKSIVNVQKGESRSYALKQTLEISHVGAFSDNALALWLPHPEDRPGQRTISSDSPRQNGENPIFLEELRSGESKKLSYEITVDVQSVHYDLSPQDVPTDYFNISSLEQWLQTEEGIPASSLRRTGLAVIKREKNPYVKASLLYDYVLWKMTFDSENPEENPDEWLSSRKSNALGFASLYVSLCRSVDLPARVVSGLWVPPGADKGVIHHWSEVYFPRAGWFPVDTAAVDGALDFWRNKEDDPPGGWGTLDASYIAFSRGRQHYKPLHHINRTFGGVEFSRQSLYAEKIGNLDSCFINWPSIAIMQEP